MLCNFRTEEVRESPWKGLNLRWHLNCRGWRAKREIRDLFSGETCPLGKSWSNLNTERASSSNISFTDVTEDLIPHQEWFFHLRNCVFKLQRNFLGGVTHFYFKIIALLVQMLCSGRLKSIHVHLAAVGRVDEPLRGGAGGAAELGAPRSWGRRGGPLGGAGAAEKARRSVKVQAAKTGASLQRTTSHTCNFLLQR